MWYQHNQTIHNPAQGSSFFLSKKKGVVFGRSSLICLVSRDCTLHCATSTHSHSAPDSATPWTFTPVCNTGPTLTPSAPRRPPSPSPSPSPPPPTPPLTLPKLPAPLPPPLPLCGPAEPAPSQPFLFCSPQCLQLQVDFSLFRDIRLIDVHIEMLLMST